jgi:hypothetical protein
MSYSCKRPCCICRKWFSPNVHLGKRQRTCGRSECKKALQQKTLAQWRAQHSDYFLAWRIRVRSKAKRTPEPLRPPPPLSKLPWDIAQDAFGVKGADFIGAMSSLVLRAAKNQSDIEVIDSIRDRGRLPPVIAKN